MSRGAPRSFGAHLKALREAAGYTQGELATIAGLSVHAISALERGERRRPHADTVRALLAALDLTGPARDEFVGSARARADDSAVDALGGGPLPLALTALLGRESDVQTLRTWLADPALRLITLTGPGGVGKTRLALEVAQAIADDGGTRVAFVPLAAVHDAELVAATIAEVLGLANVTPATLSRRARVAFAEMPALWILDTFEQVLAAAPVVADLLASVASLRLLVTSRAPLRVRGEREYVVGPLAVGADSEAMSPADLARVPAVRLFVERVREAQPGFRLTPLNAPSVARICRRVDGLPLALELAAPWMRVLTADDLLGRLTEDVLLSTVGPRDLPARQQTMNATVAWSYQLLGPHEQRVFRRLGAIPERFSIEAAAAVLAGSETASGQPDQVLTAVAALIDKSLLQRATTTVPSRPLYQMFDTVRAFAARELAVETRHDDAMEGLVRYCDGESLLAAEGLVGPAQAEWLDRVRDDLETYRRVLEWLVGRGRAVESSHIAWRLMFFWMIRGHSAEGLGWYQRALALPRLPPAAESRARLGTAFMHYAQGELEPARLGLARALALAQDAGDVDIAVQAENLSGYVHHAAGDFGAARESFTHSVAGFRAVESSWGIGNALNGLAGVALATGDAAQAERLLAEATLALRHAGPWFLLLTLYVRAVLAVRRGQAGEAIGLLRDSLTRIRALHDTFELVYALVPLAAAAALGGDDAWAARILGARDAVTESTGSTVVDKAVEDLREQAEHDVRQRLGQSQWAMAYAAGRRTSVDMLLRDIDRTLKRGSREYPARGAS